MESGSTQPASNPSDSKGPALPRAAPDKPIRLLRTKMFVPRPHPERLERPWLYERLNQGLSSKLVVVSAPAGFGKTTLLATWLQETGVRAGWLSLDERDNDPTRFWSYFVSALQMALESSPSTDLETVLGMIQAPQPAPIESILAEMINEIAPQQEDFALVLDDIQAVTHESIFTGLAYLLEHLPACLHILIAGRSEPPLPLALLRGRRELVILQAADLRFRPQDTLALFNQVMGLDLSGPEIEALEKMTEGWIAGLQLAAMALRESGGLENRQDISAFVSTFSGGHRYVFDYLAQEVLERQSDRRREFLLQTSLLERMTADLCNAVTGGSDGQSMLEQFDQENLFLVPLDQHRNWYRYHHLFADFLRNRLSQTYSQHEILQYHQRAFDWLAAHDLPEEAIQQALLAGEHQAASDLIKQIAPELFVKSELITIIYWLNQFPQEFLTQDPVLTMMYVWALLATGHSDQVEPHLQAIEQRLGWQADGSPESLAQPKSLRGSLAEISLVRGSLAFNRFDLQAVLDSTRAAEAYLQEPDTHGLLNAYVDLKSVAAFNTALAFEYTGQADAAIKAFTDAIHYSEVNHNMHILPMAYTHQAHLYELNGQLREARVIYERAQLKARNQVHPSPMLGTALTGLGNLLTEWNELAEAQELLEEGLALGRQWSLWEVLVSGYSGLTRLLAARGERQASLDSLQELADLAQRFDVKFVEPIIASRQAQLWAKLGLVEPLASWIESSGLDPETKIDTFSEEILIIYGRGLVAVGQSLAAIELLNRLEEAVELGKRWGRLIEVLIIQSSAYQAVGELEAGLRSLQRALALAEPGGYLRLFADESLRIASLLERVQGEQQAYARRLHALITAESGVRGSVPGRGQAEAAQILSEREREVLALLAEGLTNQEIADRLVISLNTVKSHVKHIYTALDVRNRAEATAKAAELGI